MKGVSLRSEAAHKAGVSIAHYNRQRSISSLFRHLKSLMQIGNRHSQCSHTEGMGAPFLPMWGLFVKHDDIFFKGSQMEGFVKCLCAGWFEVKCISLDSQWDCFDAWDVIVLRVIVCRLQNAVPEAQSDKCEYITHMDSGFLRMEVALLHTLTAYMRIMTCVCVTETL